MTQKKVKSKDLKDKPTKTQCDEPGFPTDEKTIKELIAQKCKVMGIDITDNPELIDKATFFSMGKLLQEDSEREENKELYRLASECYQSARELCDALAYKIFM